MNALLVTVGAAAGAPLRFWVDRWWQCRAVGVFPWGSLTVNITGSTVLGILAAAHSPDSTLFLLVGIGFCGALTTFSSFVWETYRLSQEGATLLSVANVAGSVVVCFAAAWIGWAVTNALV